MTHERHARTAGGIIARAMTDGPYRQKLLADPRGALREEGVELPGELEVRVVENTPRVLHLVLPAREQPERLSEADLEQVVGGKGSGGGVIVIIYGAIQLGLQVVNFVLNQIEKHQKH